MTRPKRYHVYLFILALILIVSCCHRKPVKEPEFYVMHIDPKMLPIWVIFNNIKTVRIDKDMIARVEE